MSNINNYQDLWTHWSIMHQLFYPMKNQHNGLLYQYRSFSGFWSIINSDSMWATNIRFSNDTKERLQGINLLTEIANSHNISPSFENNDYFMICFCKEDDKLSQWRGYASKGGVSMGFEFNSIMPYRILGREKTDTSLNIVVRPWAVIYTTENNKRSLEIELKRYNIFENRDNPDDNDPSANFCFLVPYMKDEGFSEEEEWRIIISENIKDINRYKFSNCIKFDDERNIKKPYIVIKAGFYEFENNDPITVRLQIINEDILKELKEKINAELSKIDKLSKVQVINCKENKDENLCYGCSQKIAFAEIPENSDNYIYCCGEFGEYCAFQKTQQRITLSQGKNQKEVFYIVDEIVHEINKKQNCDIKIWCEGHLPIRTITVSPCENKEETVESIRNYCQNSNEYWLRYVDVKGSKIPYRNPVE